MPAGRERRLALGEIERLVTALKDSPAGKAAVLLALESGMRRGELANLRWEHVDLRQSILHIPQTKTGYPRTIPLSTCAVSVLKGLPRQLAGSVLNMKQDSITQAFVRACARANLIDLRFHDLRHEATSRLFEKGLNTMQVATVTGHRTLEMLKRYTHLRASDLVAKLG
jgi:integrase